MIPYVDVELFWVDSEVDVLLTKHKAHSIIWKRGKNAHSKPLPQFLDADIMLISMILHRIMYGQPWMIWT
jgi:hypothetical protein